MAKESKESQELTPREAYLVQLRAQRDQLDSLIKSIEQVDAGGDAMRVSAGSANQMASVEGPGAFLGMTIADAALKLLALRKKALTNGEIVNAIKAGGVVLNSAQPLNTVGSILRRRQNEDQDIVRVGKTWGLAEWYPNAGRFARQAKKAATPADSATRFLKATKALRRVAKTAKTKAATSEPE